MVQLWSDGSNQIRDVKHIPKPVAAVILQIYCSNPSPLPLFTQSPSVQFSQMTASYVLPENTEFCFSDAKKELSGIKNTASVIHFFIASKSCLFLFDSRLMECSSYSDVAYSRLEKRKEHLIKDLLSVHGTLFKVHWKKLFFFDRCLI